MNFETIPIVNIDKCDYDRLSEEEKNNGTMYVVHDVEAYNRYKEYLKQDPRLKANNNQDGYNYNTLSKDNESYDTSKSNVSKILGEVESFISSLVV